MHFSDIPFLNKQHLRAKWKLLHSDLTVHPRPAHSTWTTGKDANSSDVTYLVFLWSAHSLCEPFRKTTTEIDWSEMRKRALVGYISLFTVSDSRELCLTKACSCWPKRRHIIGLTDDGVLLINMYSHFIVFTQSLRKVIEFQFYGLEFLVDIYLRGRIFGNRPRGVPEQL